MFSTASVPAAFVLAQEFMAGMVAAHPSLTFLATAVLLYAAASMIQRLSRPGRSEPAVTRRTAESVDESPHGI